MCVCMCVCTRVCATELSPLILMRDSSTDLCGIDLLQYVLNDFIDFEKICISRESSVMH